MPGYQPTLQSGTSLSTGGQLSKFFSPGPPYEDSGVKVNVELFHHSQVYLALVLNLSLLIIPDTHINLNEYLESVIKSK